MYESDLNVCPDCGKRPGRVTRNWVERLLYTRVWACPCDETWWGETRFSTVVRCPNCHRTDLRRRHERDRIDRMLRNPLRYMQRFLGGSLYHCQFCRIQFYDLRPRAKGTRDLQHS